MKLAAHWENLSEREKLALIIGSVAFIVIIIYIFLIQPFYNVMSDLESQVQNKREILSWLQPAAQKIQQYTQQGYANPPTLSGNLIDNIHSTLQAHRLNTFVTQITLIDSQQVKINFNSVPFDAAMEWLTALWLATDVQVKQTTITPLKQTGVVSLQIVLITF